MNSASSNRWFSAARLVPRLASLVILFIPAVVWVVALNHLPLVLTGFSMWLFSAFLTIALVGMCLLGGIAAQWAKDYLTRCFTKPQPETMTGTITFMDGDRAHFTEGMHVEMSSRDGE